MLGIAPRPIDDNWTRTLPMLRFSIVNKLICSPAVGAGRRVLLTTVAFLIGVGGPPPGDRRETVDEEDTFDKTLPNF